MKTIKPEITKPITLQELFSKDGSWTKRAFARDKNNNPVEETDRHAVCWCLSGGIMKIYDSNYLSSEIRKLISNELNIEAYNISVWNDQNERTIEDIRNLVKELNI